MKSKKLRTLITAGLILLPGLTQAAGVDSFLTMKMKGYYQARGSNSGSSGTGKVGAFRITAKQLLKMASNQLGTRFPSGAKMKVTTDGGVYALNAKGKVIADLSAYYKVTCDTENQLFNGKSNQPNRPQTSKNYFPVTMSFTLPNFTGTVGGLAIEEYKVTRPDKFGVKRLSASSSTAVSGGGTYNNATSYFTGNLNLQGKSALVQAP